MKNLNSQLFAKLPPHSIELEEAVLGAIILEPDCLDQIINLFPSEKVFYKESHRKIYDAIKNLITSAVGVDLLTVCQKLKENGNLEEVGGHYAVTKLTMDVVRATNIKHHAFKLLEFYLKREMIRICGEAVNSSYESGVSPFETLDFINNSISDLTDISDNRGWINGKKLKKLLFDKFEKKEQNFISSSVEGIDKINRGFKPGQMVTIGARPGVGKSVFAGRIATYAAKKSNKVGFISLEMPVEDVAGRIIAAESSVSFNSIDRGNFNASQEIDVRNHIENLAALPIYFSDTASLNVFGIRSKVEQLKRKFGINLLIVDYIQLVSSSKDKKNDNREQEVARISRNLKLMAMELDITVIALAQLNRESAKRSGKSRYPKLSDLRESGSLEQDSDVVMFLHSDYAAGIEINEVGLSTQGEVDLIVAKWRNGNPNIHVKLDFDGNIMKLTEKNIQGSDMAYSENNIYEAEKLPF